MPFWHIANPLSPKNPFNFSLTLMSSMHVWYMMLQKAVCWVGSGWVGHWALVQAELFWQACCNVALFLCIYVYYVYFTSSACVDSFISLLMPSEKGVLWIPRKDGWDTVWSCMWYFPSERDPLPSLFMLCSVNGIFKRTNPEVLSANVNIYF